MQKIQTRKNIISRVRKHPNMKRIQIKCLNALKQIEINEHTVKHTYILSMLEKRYKDEKRRQPGVVFPSAIKQGHLFIIRFNILGQVCKDKLMLIRL